MMKKIGLCLVIGLSVLLSGCHTTDHTYTTDNYTRYHSAYQTTDWYNVTYSHFNPSWYRYQYQHLCHHMSNSHTNADQ